VQGFKALRSEEGASEIIRNKLTTVKDRLTQPGEMPTVGSNFGNVADFKAPTEKAPGIIAFHGSGADFNEFRLDKINTGEGAQAFGYGLYFTDSEDIAKFYKNSVGTPINIDGKDFVPKNYKISEIVQQNSKDKEKIKEKLLDYIQEFRDNPYAEIQDAQSIINSINDNTINLDNAGKTYKVALAPKPEELLDYDLPLSEQSDLVKGKVINVLKDIYPNVKNPALTMKGSDLIKQVETALSAKNFDEVERINRLIKEQNAIMIANASPVGYRKFINKKGEDAAKEYDRLLDERAKLPTGGFDKAASELLSKQGIKGIKYKAGQLSRRVPGVKDTDATNFVIFDENLINILAKYGIVGSVGITALQNSDI
jgi:translation initiation factor 2 beta subunit (eIF-2beta)/eIF-5